MFVDHVRSLSCNVLPQVKDGTIIRGIFHTVNLEAKRPKMEVDIVVQWAKTIRKRSSQNDSLPVHERPVEYLLVPGNQWVDIRAAHKDMHHMRLRKGTTEFDIDKALAERTLGKDGAQRFGEERDLVPWQPDGAEAGLEVDLEDPVGY